jgi:hypothetical protein
MNSSVWLPSALTVNDAVSAKRLVGVAYATDDGHGPKVGIDDGRPAKCGRGDQHRCRKKKEGPQTREHVVLQVLEASSVLVATRPEFRFGSL